MFPTKWCKKRSTDDPWIDDETRDMIDRRKRVYAKENSRSAKWSDIKAKTNRMIRTRKKKFYDAEASIVSTTNFSKTLRTPSGRGLGLLMIWHREKAWPSSRVNLPTF